MARQVYGTTSLAAIPIFVLTFAPLRLSLRFFFPVLGILNVAQASRMLSLRSSK